MSTRTDKYSAVAIAIHWLTVLLLIAMHVLGFLSHLLEGDSALVRRMRPW